MPHICFFDAPKIVWNLIYVLWRSSSLKSIFISTFCAPIFALLDHKMAWNLNIQYILMSFTIVWKIEDYVWCKKICVKATLKKKFKFETPCTKHLLSVHRGSSCVNFGEKYSFDCKLKKIVTIAQLLFLVHIELMIKNLTRILMRIVLFKDWNDQIYTLKHTI